MNPTAQGTPILWITGLSGSGKTTISKAVVAKLRSRDLPVFHIDGDQIREVIGDSVGYSEDERIINAYRISRFCKLVQQQNVLGVCSTMSLYPEIWEWNRKNLSPYVEIYIRVTLDELRMRDQKGLYSATGPNVVGKDLIFNEPKHAHHTLDNNGSEDLDKNIDFIMNLIEKID
ncbi:MAG: adenylyl-sulfate kinase [Myxococcota bacterium]|nr:adenylyl-sulfate kinase [Myxococcota bacterium]